MERMMQSIEEALAVLLPRRVAGTGAQSPALIDTRPRDAHSRDVLAPDAGLPEQDGKPDAAQVQAA